MAEDSDGPENLRRSSSIVYELMLHGFLSILQMGLHSYIKLRVGRHRTNRRPRFISVNPYIKHHMEHEF